jgi:hypothetical protein
MKSSKNETPGSFLAHHWVTMLMVFIGGILVIGFLKVISQLFNSGSPLAKGVADGLGAIVNFFTGITSGCWTTQDPCDGVSEQACSKQTGCEWTPSKTSGAAGLCINTTGLKPQKGSFASPSCFIGMFTIFSVCGVIVFKIFGPIINYYYAKKLANLDAASKASDTPLSKIREDVIKEALKTADEANKLKEETTKKPSTEIEMRIIGKQSAYVEAMNKANDAIDGQSGVDPKTQAEQKQQSVDNYVRDLEQVQKDARDSGMSDNDIKDVDDAVDEASGHHVEMLDIISNNVHYNIPVMPMTLKYYINIIERKNLQLQDHQINYLNKYKNYFNIK